ncbi:MAG: Sec-independent protein translocase TatB, partial [Campylobacteraceae bacterium 4484_4]
MFGMSFGEILIIAIIAILFLGPDKLPEAMVKIAKFFKSFKKSI